ncbi:MAG: autotransporter-associated beta strand repeat-containing protein [Puniceicoccales bacterium]|jgi:autotransporter-associated beta strand protein|nr:autotransporter-associated beta strand repeat-containing protein [Puniceicoccales bacterium]
MSKSFDTNAAALGNAVPMLASAPPSNNRRARRRRPLARWLVNAAALVATSAAGFFVDAPDAAAANYYWTGKVVGAFSADWTNPANWAPNPDGTGVVTRAPGEGDDVYLANNFVAGGNYPNLVDAGNIAANIHDLGLLALRNDSDIDLSVETGVSTTLSGRNEFIATPVTQFGQRYSIVVMNRGTLTFANAESIGAIDGKDSGLMLFIYGGNVVYQGGDATIEGIYIETSNGNASSISPGFVSPIDNITIADPNATLTLKHYITYAYDVYGSHDEWRRLFVNGPGTLRLADTVIKNIDEGTEGYRHKEAAITLRSGKLILDATLKEDGSVHAVQFTSGTDGPSAAGFIVDGGRAEVWGDIVPLHANGNQIGGISMTYVNGTGILDFNGRNERLTQVTGNGTLTNDNPDAVSTVQIGYNQLASTFSGKVTGNLSIKKVGLGNLTLSGALSYTGDTVFDDAATIIISKADGENTIGKLHFADPGATLSLTGAASLQIAGFATGSVLGQIELGDNADAGAFIVGKQGVPAGSAGDGAGTFAGVISGSRSIEKHGGGELVLSGVNTATGYVAVAEGTLRLGARNTLAASESVTVLSGGRLAPFTGGVNALERVTVLDGGAIEVGSAAGHLASETVSFAAATDVNIAAGALISFNIGMGETVLDLSTLTRNNFAGGGNGAIYVSAAGLSVLTETFIIKGNPSLLNLDSINFVPAEDTRAVVSAIRWNSSISAWEVVTDFDFLDVSGGIVVGGSREWNVIDEAHTESEASEGELFTDEKYAAIGLEHPSAKVTFKGSSMSGSRSFSNRFEASGGTLAFESPGDITLTGIITAKEDGLYLEIVSGATVTLSGSVKDGSDTRTGAIYTGTSAGTLRFARATNAPVTVSASIAGEADVVVGSGVTIFAKANTLTGKVTVEGGTLRLAADNALANSESVTVKRGINTVQGAIDLGATSQEFKTFTVSEGGVVSIGSEFGHETDETASIRIIGGGADDKVTFGAGSTLLFNVGAEGVKTTLDLGSSPLSFATALTFSIPDLSPSTGRVYVTGENLTGSTFQNVKVTGVSGSVRKVFSSSTHTWEFYSTGFFVRTWESSQKTAGNWDENDYGNWNSVQLPTLPSISRDIYFLHGTGGSATITIPDNPDGSAGVVLLDGSRNSGFTDLNTWQDNNNTHYNPGGLVVDNGTFSTDPATGTTSLKVSNKGTSSTKWTITGGVLDTGAPQPDGYWAILVWRGDDNSGASLTPALLAVLNIESAIVGAGNIGVVHSGNDGLSLLVKGDASQFTGSIRSGYSGGGRAWGFTGNASIGNAYVRNFGQRSRTIEGLTRNAVFGAVFQGNDADGIRIGNNTVADIALTSDGTWTGGLGTVTTTATFTFDATNSGILVRSGALGTGTSTLNSDTTLQFISSKPDGTPGGDTRPVPVTGNIVLNNASAKIKVGTDSLRWIYGTPADYGLSPGAEITSPYSFTYSDAEGAPDSVTFAGKFSGAQILRKVGAGELILTGTNTQTGGTSIDAGTLTIASDSNLTTSTAGTHTINGGTLRFSGADGTIYTRAWTIAGSSSKIAATNNVSYAGVLTGAAFTKIGAGTLAFTTNMAYAEGITIAEGGLTLGNGGSAVGSLAGTGAITLSAPGTFFGVNVNGEAPNMPVALGRAVTGSGSFIQSGNVNLGYSGTMGVPVSVLGGTFTNQGAVNGAVTVASGATFANQNILGGAAQIASGGTFTAEAASTASMVTIADGATFVSAGGNVGDLILGNANGPGTIIRVTDVPAAITDFNARSSVFFDVSDDILRGMFTPGYSHTIFTYGSASWKDGNFSGTAQIEQADAYRATFELVDNTVDREVVLTVTDVTAPKTLRWTGSVAGGENPNWSYRLENWVESGLTTPEGFYLGDEVIFDDGADVKTKTITLSAPVTVGSVEINTAGTYTIQGAGSIRGNGTLTKKGIGTLILGTAMNSYVGGTIIEGGTVRAASTASIGTGPILLDGDNIRLEIAGGSITVPTITSKGGNNTISVPATLFSTAEVIVDGGKLTLDGIVARDIASIFSGTGDLTILGGERRVFSNVDNSNFTGKLELDAGFSFSYTTVQPHVNWSGTDIVVTDASSPALNFYNVGGRFQFKSLTFQNGNIYVGSGSGINILDVSSITRKAASGTTIIERRNEGGTDRDENQLTSSTGNLTVDTGTGTIDLRTTFVDYLTTPLTFTKKGSGTLLFNIQSTSSNRNTGGINIDEGTFVLSVASQGNGSPLRGNITVAEGATLRIDANESIGGYGGTAITSWTGIISLNGGTLTFNSAGPQTSSLFRVEMTGGTFNKTPSADGRISFYQAPASYDDAVFTIKPSPTPSVIDDGIHLRLRTRGMSINLEKYDGTDRPADYADLIVNGSIENYDTNISGYVNIRGTGVARFTGVNTYTNVTTINDSAKLVIAGNQTGATGNINITTGGTLEIVDTGSTNSAIIVAGTLLLNRSETALTITNQISGGGVIEKSGKERVSLSSDITTGTFRVKEGILQSNTTVAHRIEVFPGGNLTVSGLTLASGESFAGHPKTETNFNDITGNVTVNSGAILRIGEESFQYEQLSISGNVNFKSSSTLVFDMESKTHHDTVSIGGNPQFESMTTFKLETSDGILVPDLASGESSTYYNLFTSPIEMNESVLNNIYIDGLLPSPSIDVIPRLSDDKKTIQVEVSLSDVQFEWKSDGSDAWDYTTANWEKTSEPDNKVVLQEFGIVRLDESAENVERGISVDASVKTIGINVINTRQDLIEGYIITATETGGISGPGGILKNSEGILTLNAEPMAAGHDFSGAVQLLKGELIVDGRNSAAPILADKGQPSLLGKGASVDTLHIGGNAKLVLISGNSEVTTNRGFSLGAGGGTIEVSGEKLVNFNGTDAVEIVAGSPTLKLDGVGDGAINLKLEGSVKIEKVGGGTWSLTGAANTFTGGIVVSEGTLALGSSGAAGLGTIFLEGGTLSNKDISDGTRGITLSCARPVEVVAASIIDIVGNSVFTLGNTTGEALRGTGDLAKKGTGTLRISGSSAFTGTLTVEAGTVAAAHREALAAGVVNLGENASLELSVETVEVAGISGTGSIKNLGTTGAATLLVNVPDGEESTFSGTLSDGSGAWRFLAIEKAGEGTLTLSGSSNTHSGATIVSEGVLKLGSPGAASTRLEVKATSADHAGTLEFDGGDFSAKEARIEGEGHEGAGALRDTHGGTFPKLLLTADATICGTGTGTLSTANADPAAAASSSRNTLTLAALAAQVVTYSFSGTGTRALSGVDLAIEDSTTLHLDKSGSLDSSTAVEIKNGGELLLINSSPLSEDQPKQTLGGLNGSGGSVAGRGTLTLNVPAGGDYVFDGILKDDVSLTVQGTGVFTLARTNETHGTVTVDGGTLGLGSALTPLATGESDLLGASDSTVVLKNGTLRSTATLPSLTNRTFTLAGETSTLRGDGAGITLTADAVVTVSAGISAHRLILVGSSTENKIETSLNDPVSGSLALVKSDAGTWAVSGENTFSGGVFVENGTLKLDRDNALPTTGILQLGSAASNSSGVLQLNGHDQVLGGITVAGVGAGNRIINNTSLNTSVLTLAVAADVNFAGVLGIADNNAANNFALVKTGTGRLTLHLDESRPYAQSYTYTGVTSVREGVLAVSGAARLSSPQVLVSPGAQLDASGIVGGYGFSVERGQTLAAGSSGGETLDLVGNVTLNGGTLAVGIGAIAIAAPSAAASLAAAAPLAAADAAPLAGNTNILNASESLLRSRTGSSLSFVLTNTIDGYNSQLRLGGAIFDAPVTANFATPDGTLAIGSYPLITYTGTFSGFDNLFYESQQDPRYVLEFVHSEPAKAIFLKVSTTGEATTIVWDGSIGDQLWDATVTNFYDDKDEAVAYFPGDNALFDDSAAFFNITVGVDVSIGHVTFHNNDNNYTLQGGPIRGEGFLEKRGTGTLTLASANLYDGILQGDGTRAAGTILAGGTIVVGNDKSLGIGSLLISGTATTLSAVGGNISIGNDIAISPGVVVNFNAGAGDALLLTGSLTGSASTRIVKTGGGLLSLSADGNDFSGTISVNAGTAALDGADYTNATLDLERAGAEVVFSGGSRVGTLRGVFGTRISGTGTLETGLTGSTSNFAGSLAGALSIVKSGSGAITFTGDNAAHTGAIIVTEGRLQIGDGIGGTVGTGTFTVLDGATIALNLPGNATLNQEISGAGIFEKQGTNTVTLLYDNAALSGTVRIASGTLVLADAATLGTAAVQVFGELRLARDDDYILPNNVFGSGTVVKTGAGDAVWLGSGSVNLHVTSGSFAIGDGVTVSNQENKATLRVDDGASLTLNPAADSTTIIGDLHAAPTAIIEKTGAGSAVLAGIVDAGNGITVSQGTLFIGDGGGVGALEIAGAIDVAPDATLVFNRARETRVSGKITSASTTRFSGSETVLLNAGNELGGGVEIASNAVLQVGDATHAASLGAAPVSVALAANSTLRFSGPGGSSTGETIVLTGEGIVERNGTGELRFNSTADAFEGTFSAAAGVFTFDAANLPVATFNATGGGVLRIESSQDAGTGAGSSLRTTFGTGDGTILLSSAPDVSASYSFAVPVNFGGTLAVDARTTLALNAATLSPSTLEVRSGATLTGSGSLGGSLNNNGTVAPSATGTIIVGGDFVNEGRLVISVSASGVSTIEYAGVARIGSQGQLHLRVENNALLAELEDGQEIRFLHDTDTASGRAEVEGAFQSQNITVSAEGQESTTPVLAYSAGDGWLAMILSENIGDIPTVRQNIHSGLGDYTAYLNETLKDDHGSGLSAVVSGFLNAPASGTDIAAAINAASPLGLASLTGMGVASSHDDAASLHSHLEAARFTRGLAREPIAFQPYFSATSSFEQNADGRDGAAYDFQIYGATVGFDYGIGNDFLMGVSAAFHNGNATLDDSAGKVKQETGRISLYASTMISDKFYVEAGVGTGYSSYNVKHRTVHGEATAKPDGYDFGATAIFGSVFTVSSFHITPYTGFEYTYAHVESFTETGSVAALSVDGFKQESLRYKLGTGISWFQPSDFFASVRWSLNLAYAYELLGNDIALNSRFASDTSGRSFRTQTAAYGEHVVQAGPSLDLALTEHASVQLSYRFESDLDSQTAHNFNASFRLRF